MKWFVLFVWGPVAMFGLAVGVWILEESLMNGRGGAGGAVFACGPLLIALALAVGIVAIFRCEK